MTLKKAFGKVFGVNLNKTEQKALDTEVLAQLAEFDRQNTEEIDAMVLYILRDLFGFGEVRLRRFYDRFGPEMDELVKRYQMGEKDTAWICKRKLLESGIDMDAWKEPENGES